MKYVFRIVLLFAIIFSLGLSFSQTTSCETRRVKYLKSERVSSDLKLISDKNFYLNRCKKGVFFTHERSEKKDLLELYNSENNVFRTFQSHGVPEIDFSFVKQFKNGTLIGLYGEFNHGLFFLQNGLILDTLINDLSVYDLHIEDRILYVLTGDFSSSILAKYSINDENRLSKVEEFKFEGLAKAIEVNNNAIYVLTNQGIYLSDKKEYVFHKMEIPFEFKDVGLNDFIVLKRKMLIGIQGGILKIKLKSKKVYLIS